MTESDLAGRPVDALLGRMAAARPDPAAGTAAALTVALAAALLGKTARLSRRHVDDADQVAERADDLRERALRLGEADARAVATMVGGGPTPDAVDVPRQIAELAAEVDRLAAHLGERGNPRLRADARAAHHLADAAARTARELVRSNQEPPG